MTLGISYIGQMSRDLISRKDLPTSIKIFDTTLREGDQTPTVALTFDQKLDIARRLDDIGVHIIEAGFPPVSEQEAKSVEAICNLGLNAEIVAEGRCNEKEMDLVMDCGVDVAHTFLGISEIHRDSLGLSKEEVISKSVEIVEYCHERGFRTDFSVLDSTRTEIPFLIEFSYALKSANLDVLCLPDTAGVILPEAYRFMIETVLKSVKTELSVHCHNDLGLALANVLAGVEGGANIVEVTVNGLGDRTGNPELTITSLLLEEAYGYELGIDYKKAMKLSHVVEEYSGIPVHVQQPIIGDFAWAHESGIHVSGQLSRGDTFEALNPEAFGRKSEVVLGKHSGKSAVLCTLQEEDFEPSFEELQRLTLWVKSTAESGERVTKKMLFNEFKRMKKCRKHSKN